MTDEKKKRAIKLAKQYVLVTLGVIILDISFYFFMDPASIVTGGMFGLSIILEPLFDMAGDWFTVSTFLYIVNITTLILGLIFLGKDFFIKTIYGTLLTPTIVLVLERTCDPNFFYAGINDGNKELISLICGALLCGVGVGIAIHAGGSTGGMDVVQKIMSKYIKIPMSVSMYLTDGAIVLLAGFLLSNKTSGEMVRSYTYMYQIENVVWGVLGVVIQGYIIDYICLNARSRRTVYVITNHPDKIRDLIYQDIGRGVTLSDVRGGYTNDNKTMIICTMDKNEAYRVTESITELEPEAFTFVTSCKQVSGEYDKRGIL